jgi:rhodanese-related sulfurtransferase
MRTIDRIELIQLMRNAPDVVLVEVDGGDIYEDWHLPGAISIPFDYDFNARVEATLTDTDRPIVVYGLEKAAQVGRLAADRLDELGYDKVFWYQDGKDDWKEAGERVEHGVRYDQHPLSPVEENLATWRPTHGEGESNR